MNDASDQSSDANDELVLVALGGLGEIGMNVYLYGIGPPDDRRWLMVDLGLTFPGDNEPGVDVVLPELKFIAEQRAQLDGIVITHAHEDHLGALIESWPQLRCPVYATPFTVGMLKAKLAEFGGDLKPDIHEIPIDSKFKVGGFDLELRLDVAFDSGNVGSCHSHPAGHGISHRRLEARRTTADREPDER